MVPEVSKKFLPQMSVGFNDPRVQLHICDGIKYVQDAAESSFDVIIVDSSDPGGRGRAVQLRHEAQLG